MDLDSFEGRQDFFLLKLHVDRLNRIAGKSAFSQFEFQLHLDLMSTGEPPIDAEVFLVNLLDKGYIDHNLSYNQNDAPYVLTKEGSEFVNSNGFTEKERRRLVELQKDEKVKHELKDITRKNKWFYPLLLFAIISATGNVVTIYKYLTPPEKSLVSQPMLLQKPQIKDAVPAKATNRK